MDIERLHIPKGKANQFRNKGINTVEDLVKFLPRQYLDFRENTAFNLLKDGDMASVIGNIVEIRSGEKYFRLKVMDDFNKVLYVTFFNQNYNLRIFQVGNAYNFCGKIEENKEYHILQMVNPLYYSDDLDKYRKIIPIYSRVQGMSEEYLLRSINTALAVVDKSEYLHSEILDKFNLPERKETISGIHQPNNFKEVETSRNRLLFDDLFLFASQIAYRFKDAQLETDVIFSRADTIKSFLQTLDYELTDDQIKTVRSIFKNARSGRRVNALVQGDVGSGKTIVAFLLMLIAAENGYQSTLMCPTNVLAVQHYEEMKKIGKKMGYETAFLSGSTKAKEKRRVIEGLKSGEILFAVGTHALISKDVGYKNLGLSIVDEEHRFGVIQRTHLTEQSNSAIHSITMSATPIPRSLALTTHGESVEVYNINQMPAGRKPVKTELHTSGNSAYELIGKEVKKGRQCYVVCPLIEESESAVMEGVMSATELYRSLKKHFIPDNIRIDFISGSMKRDEIDRKIELFTEGKTDVLVSTTIIEVGVNIPNASVMMIQNAERFGLAQLHQLRGRVGRGNHQSYCVMVSTDTENEKLKVMVETTNGFKIAEADLKLRGPGDFVGTRQSGDNKYIMLMLAFPELFQNIRKEVKNIFTNKELFGRYHLFLEEVRASLE